jgi:hypothetical protein
VWFLILLLLKTFEMQTICWNSGCGGEFKGDHPASLKTYARVRATFYESVKRRRLAKLLEEEPGSAGESLKRRRLAELLEEKPGSAGESLKRRRLAELLEEEPGSAGEDVGCKAVWSGVLHIGGAGCGERGPLRARGRDSGWGYWSYGFSVSPPSPHPTPPYLICSARPNFHVQKNFDKRDKKSTDNLPA